MVRANQFQQVALRNATIQGNFSIPRAVRLVDGGRLDGWRTATQFGSTSMQLSASLKEVRALTNNPRNVDPMIYPPGVVGGSAAPAQTPDWTAEAGVLKGRLVAEADRSARAVLQYARPLQVGDKLRYQFLCKPDEVMIHPAVGRVCLL